MTSRSTKEDKFLFSHLVALATVPKLKSVMWIIRIQFAVPGKQGYVPSPGKLQVNCEQSHVQAGRKITSMATPFLALVLLSLSAVEGMTVVPKLDLSGIEAEHYKQLTVPTLNPMEVKTVLKVNLVHSDPSEILICTLDGKCKLYPIKGDKRSEDEQQQEEKVKETYNPVMVTDFDLVEEDNKADDGKTEVPVFVPPHDHPWEQETVRLPIYFGLKLGPDRVVLQPIEYADVPDRVGFRYPNPYSKIMARDRVRTAIGRRSGVYWTTPNDKIDLEVSSTDDEVKVVSKLGELLGD